MAPKTFNVGVVGYGLSAKIFHIPFITTTPQLTLHAIVQRSPQPGNSAPADHPALRHYTSSAALLADPAIDIITITTPPDTHFALTKAALIAGKHVLTEKPFVPTSAEADILIALAKEKNRLLCVYQNRRWDADFLLVKHLIHQDVLGRVLEFNTHFDRYRPAAPTSWKGALTISAGGSALFDLGAHLIDQAYTLFGLPHAVHARLLNQRSGLLLDAETPDAVSAELSYPSYPSSSSSSSGGLLVHVRISALSAETQQPRFWVRGSKASFRKFGLDPQEDQLRAGVAPTADGFGFESVEGARLVVVDEGGKPREEVVPQLEPETYRAFYSQFGAAVASGRAEDVPVKAEEARDVLRIIEAVVESAKTGKDVILG